MIHAQKAYRSPLPADGKPKLKSGASMASLDVSLTPSKPSPGKKPSRGNIMEGSAARMVVTLLDGESGQGWLKAESHQVVGLECPSWPEDLRLPLAAGSAQRMDVQMDVRMTDETGAHEPSEAVGLS